MQFFRLNLNSMRIGMIGAGRVGGHLAHAFAEAGHEVTVIYARRKEQGEPLAAHFSARYEGRLDSLIPDEADLWIFALSDDAIEPLAKHLAWHWKKRDVETWVVHCSGAVSSEALDEFSRYGVFYPLQSLSAKKKPNFAEVPFCITASREEDYDELEELAASLGSPYYRLYDEQRAALHLAAVWANNFSNHLWAISEIICQEQGLPFELLHPLIRESVRKIEFNSPIDMQTGPAQRVDWLTMDKHALSLAFHARWQELYRLLSEDIMDLQKRRRF